MAMFNSYFDITRLGDDLHADVPPWQIVGTGKITKEDGKENGEQPWISFVNVNQQCLRC